MPLEIIGHRGAPREYPENTLPAFQRALELGADGIELDVHVSRDGVPVVHHDPSVAVPHSGATAARAVLSELTFGEIARLADRGSVEVPTLASVLDLAEGRGKVYVELKGAGTEAPVARLLAGREHWTAVHAFDHRAPKRARALCPALPAGILLQSYLVDTAAALASAGASDVWQWHEYIDDALVRHVHAAGGRVIAWTVNDPAVARSLSALGVDAICTDLPAEIREAVAQR